MFDIGFWELSLIAVIALLILGPERLPRAARQAGLWAGKMKRMVSEVKSNINEELRMEELNALKQAGQDLKEGLESTRGELSSVEQEMKQSAGEISSAAGEVDIASAINASAPTPSDGVPPASGSGAGADLHGATGTMHRDEAAPVPETPRDNGAASAGDSASGSKVKTEKTGKARSASKSKSGGKGKKHKKSEKKGEKSGA